MGNAPVEYYDASDVIMFAILDPSGAAALPQILRFWTALVFTLLNDAFEILMSNAAVGHHNVPIRISKSEDAHILFCCFWKYGNCCHNGKAVLNS